MFLYFSFTIESLILFNESVLRLRFFISISFFVSEIFKESTHSSKGDFLPEKNLPKLSLLSIISNITDIIINVTINGIVRLFILFYLQTPHLPPPTLQYLQLVQFLQASHGVLPLHFKTILSVNELNNRHKTTNFNFIEQKYDVGIHKSTYIEFKLIVNLADVSNLAFYLI